VRESALLGVLKTKEKKMKVFTSGNVSKFVFDQDDSVYETVLYKYHNRTVVCCSVMSGCPVGCTFCGTGNRFVKNLSAKEIVGQIYATVGDKEPQGRFQIMFMSMGEPMLNWDNVSNAIQMLSICYPDAELLISTIAPITSSWDDLLMCSYIYKKIGLQFSIHQSTDERRNMLIPYTRKLPLSDISSMGKKWNKATGRKPYCNYCIDGTNNTMEDAARLMALFPPQVFCFTFSVICSADESMKEAGFKNLDIIREFERLFIDKGYNTRIFDPEGQDDIGGGCGQLWYTQQWMKEHKNERP